MALKIVFAGSGEFGAPTLGALIDSGHEIVQVISQPPRPAGRGKKIQPTPIARLASERGLNVISTANINEEKLEPADLLVVIAFGQKIAPHIVDHPRLGSINLHASLLPKYRGAAPINWAIMCGEQVTGNSVIRLAQKMDAGAILGYSELAIGELETAGELHDRLAQDGGQLLTKVVGELESGKAVERTQAEKLATLAPKLNRAATQLDWNLKAPEVAARIRGLYPWPGCRVRVGQNLTLVRARATDHPGEPGIIGADGSIGASGGSVEVVEVQPEGKRPMTLAAYRNGHPWEAGTRVESL
jgi:methionyl-tRNA formyltransferase